MNILEGNIVRSFKLVKNDLGEIQTALAVLEQRQKQLEFLSRDLNKRSEKLSEMLRARKTALTHSIASTGRKNYVASKGGKVVHISNCPFAKNIKPKSRIVFKTKTRAFNTGYKACECLKRI